MKQRNKIGLDTGISEGKQDCGFSIYLMINTWDYMRNVIQDSLQNLFERCLSKHENESIDMWNKMKYILGD